MNAQALWSEFDAASGTLRLAVFAVFYLAVWLPLICGVLYGIYFLLTLPLRRNERARLFLDLIELGLKNGHTPEESVLSAGASRDPALGTRFYLLAAHVASGLRLGEALRRVPALLPPPVCAMWRVGERAGEVTKILPACRQFLRDGVSQTRSAINYLVVLLFCVTPASLLVAVALTLVTVPKLTEVFVSTTEQAVPGFSQVVFGLWQSGLGMGVQGLFVAALWLGALFYVAGPRLRVRIARFWPGLVDGLVLALPWRRRRLLRDFSAMLAVLLDSGVPEADAVDLAAEATSNTVFARRAARVRERLAAGATLPEALEALERTGELRWRIDNARHGRTGFGAALAGWQEALDAKAFQLEQAAAQSATTALVLVNGAIIGSLSAATFLLLVRVLEVGVLW